jgi:hypothetical protein
MHATSPESRLATCCGPLLLGYYAPINYLGNIRRIRGLQIRNVPDLLLVIYSILVFFLIPDYISAIIADIMRKWLSIAKKPSTDSDSDVLVYG